MWLVDTNIWLEVLLEQDRSDQAERFLKGIPDQNLAISEFSLSSIGLILVHRGASTHFQEFVDDILIQGNVHRAIVPSEEMPKIPNLMEKYGLDFDDAYQYCVANRLKAPIVSFDDDFDEADLQRFTPEQALAEDEDTSTQGPL